MWASTPGKLVVGRTGTEAQFVGPYLSKQSGAVDARREAIDDIHSAAKRELSCGYRYRADMTPGSFNGEPYDGVMRPWGTTSRL